MTAVVTVVQVFDKPERHPFTCAKCLVGDGSKNREFFVHIGIEYDFEGVVYLCDKCLEDICMVTGVLFTRQQLDDYLNLYKLDAAVGSEKAKKYERAVELLESIGVDFETMLKGLEDGIGLRVGESTSDPSVEGVGGSEPEIVESERNSVEDVGEPVGSDSKPDVHTPSVNPLIADIRLDL